MVRIYIVLFISLITGCATNYATKNSSDVTKAVITRNSDFDKELTFIGPQAMSETRRGIFVDNLTTQLIVAKNKRTAELRYIVYVKILYSFDWRFYNSVSHVDGTLIEVKSLNKEVNSCTGAGCIHTEEISFVLDESRVMGTDDLVFRLNSRRGAENILRLSRSYISGVLNAVEINAAVR